jgi:hypothetical protein
MTLAELIHAASSAEKEGRPASDEELLAALHKPLTFVYSNIHMKAIKLRFWRGLAVENKFIVELERKI